MSPVLGKQIFVNTDVTNLTWVAATRLFQAGKKLVIGRRARGFHALRRARGDQLQDEAAYDQRQNAQRHVDHAPRRSTRDANPPGPSRPIRCPEVRFPGGAGCQVGRGNRAWNRIPARRTPSELAGRNRSRQEKHLANGVFSARESRKTGLKTPPRPESGQA